MIVKSKLNGQLRRPQNAAQRKSLAGRDWLRRQQESAPVTVIDGVAGVDTPSESILTPNLNGDDQYIRLPLITLSGDYEFLFTIKPISPQVSFNGVAYDSTGVTTAFIRFRNSDGLIQFNGFSGTDIRVNAVPSSGSNDYKLLLKRVGATLTLDVDGIGVYSGSTGLGDVTIDTFGNNGLSSSSIRIYNIRLNDGLLHDYPCNDGIESNPIIKNRGSAGDATIVGAKEDTWKELQ